MKNIKYKNQEDLSLVPVGEVEYGTLIDKVSGNLESVYIKINKKRVGDRLELRWKEPGISVLANIRTGSLRTICGSHKVRILKEELLLEEVIIGSSSYMSRKKGWS